MKYDLTSLFYDYIQEEENKAFRREYWNRPANSELERAMQPILMTCNEDGEETINNYASCAEEFGFLTGFQLAVNLLSGGLGARAPKVEVQA